MIRRRALYAEDEYTNRRLLEIKLRLVGVDCDLAADGLAAIELFRKNTYDVVILDQYMPGLNGVEVAVEIRKVNASIPLIAITSDAAEAERFARAGFNEVLVKPLRGQDYIGRILSYAQGT